MALHRAGGTVTLLAGGSSRWPRAHWSRRLSVVALAGAAYATYVAVTAALLAQVATVSAEKNPAVGVAEPSAASGAPLVLTITVDGAIGPLKLYCATTTDRVGSDEVHVSAAELVQLYMEVCRRDSPD